MGPARSKVADLEIRESRTGGGHELPDHARARCSNEMNSSFHVNGIRVPTWFGVEATFLMEGSVVGDTTIAVDLARFAQMGGLPQGRD
jgi:hypothetical protein